MERQQLGCAGEKGMSCAATPKALAGSRKVFAPRPGWATLHVGQVRQKRVRVDRSSFGDGLKKEDSLREKKGGEERLSRPALCQVEGRAG